jgi:putative nucleotidyltransferase with HDIG domain
LLHDTAPRVLVVDDDPAVRSLFVRALKEGACRVGQAPDAEAALPALEAGDYDIVLCDMHMPRVNGLELLRTARMAQWDLGFILITGQPQVPQILEALPLQVFDFLLKPVSLRALAESVYRTYQRLTAEREARIYRHSLEKSVERRTRELESALRCLESNYVATLEALVAALDAREHETYAHSFRVRAYTLHLARLVHYPPALLRQLENAALLHDIGKVAVADAILLKPGKLTPEEWVEMKKHPVVGEQILNRISFLRPAAGIVRQHHERYDGTGYPDGLQGEEIDLGARIFAVADTLDAMTSDRFYRKALSLSAAREEITRGAWTQFDPHLVEAFLSVSDEAWAALRGSAESQHAPPAPAAMRVAQGD